MGVLGGLESEHKGNNKLGLPTHLKDFSLNNQNYAVAHK